MDIVLNGFCKQSASYRKCLGKSSTYKRLPLGIVVHRKKFSNFCRGGEGGRSVGQSCGSIRHTEKAKMEKKGEESTIRYEKKGVGGSHKAESGRNSTTKETQRS
jgi:hypothetical protein